MNMRSARFCRITALSLSGFLCITWISIGQAQSVSTTPNDTQQLIQTLLLDSPWRASRVNANSTRAVHTSNPRLNKLTQQLALEVASRNELRLVNILGRNDVINLSDLFYLRGVDTTFIRSDTVEFVKRRNEFPGITRVVNTLARLYEERLVVLARGSMESILQLDEKSVAMGLPGSGEHVTGSLVLELSGVQAEVVHMSTEQALEQLDSRQIDAVVLLMGPDGELASDSGNVGIDNMASWWRKLARRDTQILPVELNQALDDVYVASELTRSDLPGMFDDADSVPTLAVQTIVAAFHRSPRNPRHEMSLRFVQAFMDSQTSLQEGEHAKDWQGLNFEFEVPGIPQLGMVRTILQERAAAEAEVIEAQKAQQTALMALRMERLEQKQAQIDQLIAERLDEATDEEFDQLQTLIEELDTLVDDLERKLDGG